MPSELTTTNCRGLAYSREHIVQLSGKSLKGNFPSVNDGDYLLLSNNKSEFKPSILVKLQRKDSLASGEIGVGTNVHRAIGIELDDKVSVSRYDEGAYNEKPINRLLRTRPAICRVRKAVLPDPEFRVCRLPEEVLGLIGVEEGDKVVLESPSNTTAVRALRITDELRKKKDYSINEEPDRYPNCDCHLVEGEHEVPVDIPSIYIDYDTRADLGLTGEPFEGVCQPIRVYRHNQSVTLKLIDDLTLPVLALLLSLVLLLGPFLSEALSLMVVLGGFVGIFALIVVQSIYRARRNI